MTVYRQNGTFICSICSILCQIRHQSFLNVQQWPIFILLNEMVSIYKGRKSNVLTKKVLLVNNKMLILYTRLPEIKTHEAGKIIVKGILEEQRIFSVPKNLQYVCLAIK